jgi:hypothetical protein
MPISRLPLDEQIDALREILSHNTVLTEVLARATELNLPGWYLTAGCVFQTVRNVVTGRPATDGIRDYDLFYFDDTDLSWEAEDTVCCLGIRVEPSERWRVYAPHGLSDVFTLVVRPNPIQAPRHVYQTKTDRWRRQWPTLTVLPWPTTADDDA